MNTQENTLTRITLKDGDVLPFVGMTQNLGRAEFQVCPQWKRGKLVKLSIYPLQQEKRDYYYEWEGNGKKSIMICSYEDLKYPDVWKHSYCKEHKCQTMRMYVPVGANFIWFQVYSDSITIGFLKNK